MPPAKTARAQSAEEMIDDAAKQEDKAASFGFSGEKGLRALHRAADLYLHSFRAAEERAAQLGGDRPKNDDPRAAAEWSLNVHAAVESLIGIARTAHRLSSHPNPPTPPSLSLHLLLLATHASRLALSSASHHNALLPPSSARPIPTTDASFNLAQQLRDLADTIADRDVVHVHVHDYPGPAPTGDVPTTTTATVLSPLPDPGTLPDPPYLAREAAELLGHVYVEQVRAAREQEWMGWTFHAEVDREGSGASAGTTNHTVDVDANAMDTSGTHSDHDHTLDSDADPVTPLALHDTLLALAGALGDLLQFAAESDAAVAGASPSAALASVTVSIPDALLGSAATTDSAATPPFDDTSLVSVPLTALAFAALRAPGMALRLVPGSPEALHTRASLAAELANATHDVHSLEQAAAELETVARSAEAAVAALAGGSPAEGRMGVLELRAMTGEALSERGDALLALARLAHASASSTSSAAPSRLRPNLAASLQSYSRALTFTLPPPSPFTQPVPLSCFPLLLRLADLELLRAASGTYSATEVATLVKNAESYAGRAEKCAKEATLPWRVQRPGGPLARPADPLAVPSILSGGFTAESDAMLARCTFVLLRCCSFRSVLASSPPEALREAAVPLVKTLLGQVVVGETWEAVCERVGPEEDVAWCGVWAKMGDADAGPVLEAMWKQVGV
ncbi:hypothetical protein HDU93_000853 [Gonapodya sp. JEL0774]|nr:hypothetical protein HDU93_000853 [Gonapodya sp. JEL0774]